jgi:hypothetical protein
VASHASVGIVMVMFERSATVTLEEVLKAIEDAKKNGKDRVTFKGMFDANLVDKLEYEHDVAIMYTGIFDDGKTDTIVSWSGLDIEMREMSKMLSGQWHYQVIYYEDDGIFPYYSLNEVIPNKDGTIGMCMARNIVMGDRVEDITNSLKLMLSDVKNRPVIRQKDLPK